jgi:hypothetical protein
MHAYARVRAREYENFLKLILTPIPAPSTHPMELTLSAGMIQ